MAKRRWGCAKNYNRWSVKPSDTLWGTVSIFQSSIFNLQFSIFNLYVSFRREGVEECLPFWFLPHGWSVLSLRWLCAGLLRYIRQHWGGGLCHGCRGFVWRSCHFLPMWRGSRYVVVQSASLSWSGWARSCSRRIASPSPGFSSFYIAKICHLTMQRYVILLQKECFFHIDGGKNI